MSESNMELTLTRDCPNSIAAQYC